MSAQPVELPHSDEAECAVIGAMLLDSSCIPRVLRLVPSAAFYDAKRAKVYAAIGRVSGSGEPVTAVLVADDLRARGELDLVGGMVAIAELLDSVATSANVESHARVVLLRWVARKVAHVGSAVAERAKSGESVDDLLAELGKLQDEAREGLGAGCSESLIASDWNALDLRHAHIPKPPSLLGDRLMKRGGLGMIFGQPGLGKSWLTLQLAYAIARAELFMGIPTSRGNTALLSLEDPPDEIEDRLAAISEKNGGTAGGGDKGLERIRIIPREGLRRALDLLSGNHVLALIDYCKTWRIDLLVIDALSRAHLADENSNAEMGALIAASDEIRIKSGAFVLFSHHERKPAVGPKKGALIDPYSMRGASSLLGGIRTQFQFAKHPSGLFMLATSKQNYGAQGDGVTWLSQSATGPFVAVPPPEESQSRAQDNAEAIVKLLQAAPETWFTGAEIASKLKLVSVAGKPVAERTIVKYIKDLVSSGELEKAGKNRSARYRYQQNGAAIVPISSYQPELI